MQSIHQKPPHKFKLSSEAFGLPERIFTRSDSASNSTALQKQQAVSAEESAPSVFKPLILNPLEMRIMASGSFEDIAASEVITALNRDSKLSRESKDLAAKMICLIRKLENLYERYPDKARPELNESQNKVLNYIKSRKQIGFQDMSAYLGRSPRELVKNLAHICHGYGVVANRYGWLETEYTKLSLSHAPEQSPSL
jgi:hypothetical protein